MARPGEMFLSSGIKGGSGDQWVRNAIRFSDAQHNAHVEQLSLFADCSGHGIASPRFESKGCSMLTVAGASKPAGALLNRILNRSG
jgi:hypothetical protein